MNNKVIKAVIPVAGLGTRMLPATKAIPKELLPIFDRPLIQHVVEEAIDAGIREIILVTRSGKESIENHFDANYELEHRLENAGSKKILGEIKNVLSKEIKISSIRQSSVLGLGHAILCAKHVVNKEPFAVLLPDEILISENGNNSLRAMMDAWKIRTKGQVMVQKIKKKDSSEYGIVDLNNKRIMPGESKQISRLIEKPNFNNSPSNLRVVGRYILPPSIMDFLEKTKPGRDGEVQLTDALDQFIHSESGFLEAHLSDAEIYDCGSKRGFLGANIALASKDKKLKNYLKGILLK